LHRWNEGSFVLGGAAVQTLHARTKPPAYVIGEITVKDQDGYKNDFLPPAQKAIKESGGKYIAGGFNKTLTFDGASNRVVILQFESMDAAKAWDAHRTRNAKLPQLASSNALQVLLVNRDVKATISADFQHGTRKPGDPASVNVAST
jgi:uncharacterized protein (DUF1330 family)